MSSVVVEPTGKHGQLYFSFAETGQATPQNAGIGLVTSPKVGARPDLELADGGKPDGGQQNSAAGGLEDLGGARQVAMMSSTSRFSVSQHDKGNADRDLQPVCRRRVGKPVRIGAVMFELLRDYGITEEEITEGLKNYATGQRLCMR